jgi:YbbR domain-containing protein
MRFDPREVSIYGPQQVLDSISEVVTENVEVNEIKDTMQYDAPLQKIPMVSCSDSLVRLHFQTERFTEKTIFVPVSIINLPEDKELKIFPSNVSVSFNVGLSRYDSIGATTFSFYVDYKKALEGADRLEVSCKETLPSVFGLKIKPSEVDYIIEMKTSEEKAKK